VCGICGVFEFGKTGRAVEETTLIRKRDTMTHRGPADAGTIWITFNGEIYNHVWLRRDLEARGHVYRSRTDPETLLHLREEEGPEFFGLLQGKFALAIWDGRRKELLLVRDRIGVKPLYYAVLPGTILLASEAARVDAQYTRVLGRSR
jgi:asparagine synthase (glutamine-hydrolysing)